MIQGGKVVIEDGRKGAMEYQPPRKVLVEIQFDASEDLDKASEIAAAKVAELLGVTVASSMKPGIVGISDKERLAAEAGLHTKPVIPAKAPPKPRKQVLTPPKPDNDELTVEPAATADDELTASEVPAVEEITDQDLLDKITRKNETLKDAARIRALKDEFFPKDGNVYQFKQIPQEKRAEFLEKLSALK